QLAFLFRSIPANERQNGAGRPPLRRTFDLPDTPAGEGQNGWSVDGERVAGGDAGGAARSAGSRRERALCRRAVAQPPERRRGGGTVRGGSLALRGLAPVPEADGAGTGRPGPRPEPGGAAGGAAA